MGKYFGTDGVRGIANKELNAELAFYVGGAAATVLDNSMKKPRILIGKDTRISSDMIEAALVAGICSAGADAVMLGVMPTPAVAYLTVKTGADMGIVISASHNPFEHNGIKIFNGSGYKLPDELEARIEDIIDGKEPMRVCTHGDIGHSIIDDGRGMDTYIDHLASKAECRIRGLRVAIDCANGASAHTASELFSRFDIDFELLSDHPNGTNINNGCGSTHLEWLQSIVRAGGFDLGIAFDGDADRCLVVDENGCTVDGDRIMAVCGRAMKEKGKLKNDGIVATVMSNLGFHEFAKREGIELHCAAVGDRNVLEMMQEKGCCLGGEQSGHLIFLDDSTTGDGQLAAVKFLSLVAESGRKVSQIVGDVPQYPQVLINQQVSGNDDKKRIMESVQLQEAIAEEEKKLGEDGRILVRPSGTEALIRVMVEARDDKIAEETAKRLISLIKSL